MLSNRESARRSRKRKQEHMQSLEMQIEELAELKKEKESVADMAERRCRSLEDENQRLREENERLRDELRFLRVEVRRGVGGVLFYMLRVVWTAMYAGGYLCRRDNSALLRFLCVAVRRCATHCCVVLISASQECVQALHAA
jgi:FtsZ-binding cell division protein ZapB